MKRIGLKLVLGSVQCRGQCQAKSGAAITGTLEIVLLDSAYDGMQMAQEELGIQARIIEMSYDQSKRNLPRRCIEQDYDVIILGLGR